MAFSTPAEVVSLLGDAEIVRHVYLPGLTKSYTIWTARLDAGGWYLVTRPSEAVDFDDPDHSDLVIAGPFDVITAVAAHETTTTNIVAIVFESPTGLWVVEYNYSTQIVSSGPTLLYAGSSPSLAEGPNHVLASYLIDGALNARKGLLASELEIVRPSSNDYIDHDTHEKVGAPAVYRYLGLQGQRPAVSRLFQADVDTEALFVSGLSTTVGSTPALYDFSGNGLHLELGGNLDYNSQGIQFDGSYIPSISVLPLGAGNTFEAWITPKFSAHSTYIVSGDVFFGYRNDGRMFFGFDDGGNIKYFVQKAGRKPNRGRPNYLVAIHTFGSASSTRLVVNGSEVEGEWVKGVGNEDPALTDFAATIELGFGELLHQWMASSVAKTLAQIQDYAKGKM